MGGGERPEVGLRGPGDLEPKGPHPETQRLSWGRGGGAVHEGFEVRVVAWSHSCFRDAALRLVEGGRHTSELPWSAAVSLLCPYRASQGSAGDCVGLLFFMMGALSQAPLSVLETMSTSFAVLHLLTLKQYVNTTEHRLK